MSDAPDAGDPAPDDLDPDIEVPEGTEVDMPADVLAEFEQMLDAYEDELRQRLGEQFADYEDIDHPDEPDPDDQT